MFNTHDAIAVLSDCESVIASTLLDEGEKTIIANALIASMPDPEFCPNGALVAAVKGAIRRHLDKRTDAGPRPAAKVQGRATQGKQKPA